MINSVTLNDLIDAIETGDAYYSAVVAGTLIDSLGGNSHVAQNTNAATTALYLVALYIRHKEGLWT